MGKRIFVTVGSTRFDELISIVDSPAFISLASNLGYTEITAQIGNFDRTVKNLTHSFPYAKPNEMKCLFEGADLVIGHAGAGTIMEVLRIGKPLLVVVNDSLMANHQTEVADALCKRNLLKMATVSSLMDVFRENEFPAHRLTLSCDGVVHGIGAFFGFDDCSVSAEITSPVVTRETH
jgi:beta-1,4-N-acetylglucosaminyltransferase